MTRKGRAGAALFISAWGSWIGGTLSIIGIMFLAPPLADFAMKFGPPEMCTLLLVAFLLLGSLGTGSFIKTMGMVLLGLLVGTVGMDSLAEPLVSPMVSMNCTTALIRPRCDGGIRHWGNTFGTGESLVRNVYKPKFRELFPTRQELRASWGPIFRGSGLGFAIGLLRVPPHLVEFCQLHRRKSWLKA
jgi:putative tricarboxylic transport membrane protein